MDLVTTPLRRGDAVGLVPPVEIDERAARRSLRSQVAKLEADLCATFAGASPQVEINWSVGARGGPRVLGLGELERVRDRLTERLAQGRTAIAARSELEAANRRLLERVVLDPGRHKFVRIACQDLGERGCGAYEVRPRLGLIGMLMGWWQVKLSSGCPLPWPHGAAQPQAQLCAA